MWRWPRSRDWHRRLSMLRSVWCAGVQRHPWTATRIAGLFPVFAVLGIIVLAYITAVPYSMVLLARTKPVFGSIVLIIFHFVYVMVVTNYLILVYMDPGGIPEDWKASSRDALAGKVVFDEDDDPRDEDIEDGDEESVSRRILLPQESGERRDVLKRGSVKFKFAPLMQERTEDGNLRFCRYCNVFKPDRSHHCSTCGQCRLRCDHHCVFVSNCISFNTYKFFLGFITYAFIGCLMVSVFSFRTFIQITIDQTFPATVSPKSKISVSGASSTTAFAGHLSGVPPYMMIVFIIGYIMSSAFAFALAIFVGFHGYLLVKGRTTIEMYEISDSQNAARIKCYDLGPVRNFQAVCGSIPILWFLPTRAFIKGDGLSYERMPLKDDEVV